MTKFAPRLHREREGATTYENYHLSVYVSQHAPDDNSVSLSTTDAAGDETLIRLAPDKARQVAQDITAAAEFLDARVPEVGDTVKTVGQLNNLPARSVVLTGGGGRAAIKSDSFLAPNSWNLTSGVNTTPDVLHSMYGPLKVLHLPQEN